VGHNHLREARGTLPDRPGVAYFVFRFRGQDGRATKIE
jgi:hypothetical protein